MAVPFGGFKKRNEAQQFLEATPQAAYMSFLPQLNRPMKRYFGGQFGDIYGEYMGALGQEAQTMDRLPKMQFMDFLDRYPFMQEFGGLAPQQRGFYPSRYAPRTRWLNY